MSKIKKVKGNPKCTECALHQTAQITCAMGQGPIPCDYMIISDSPGLRRPNIPYKPFSGKSGVLLRELLDNYDMCLEDFYITNLVKCRPPGNRAPSKTEIKSCAYLLEKEMRVVKPKYVLIFGANAYKAVIGKGTITKNHGELIEKEGITYLATFSPGIIFREPKKEDLIRSDIERFLKLTQGELSQHKLNLRVIKNYDHFNECLQEIRESRAISFDLETTGLNPHLDDMHINCLGICTDKLNKKEEYIPRTQWILPMSPTHSPFSEEDLKKILTLIRDTSHGKKIITQNGKFDNKWLRVLYDIRFSITFDTMLAAYVLNENRPLGLKYLARVYFDAPDYDISASEKQGKTGHFNKMYEYCGWDVYFTYLLYTQFKNDLNRDKALRKVFSKLLMPAFIAFEEIESHGVYIDTQKLGELDTLLHSQLKEQKEKLEKYAPGVNWNSPKQVGKVLYEDWGLDPLDYTPTGNPSTSEGVLNRLKDKHPGVSVLLEYRATHKMISGFIEGWNKHLHNGRMYPSYKLHGTVTGRLSCSDPNLQQVPRDTRIRSLVCAPPGWTFLEFDYSQVELRIAALISNDPTMKAIFNDPDGDIHLKTASIVSGKHPDKVTKDERKKAKAVNFGFLYGMGAKKFLEYARDKFGAELTLDEAKDFRNKFFDTYGSLPRWHERQKRLVNAQGFVRTLTGRKRRLPEVNSSNQGLHASAERQAINTPVQSFGSDLTVMSVIEVINTFSSDEVKIVGTVHDAILFEVRNEVIEEVIPKIQKIMEKPPLLKDFKIKLTIPIIAEPELGNWGTGVDLEEYKESKEKGLWEY